MPSVLQSWLEDIPLRMQSTLLLGLRGPDTHACPEVKKVQRWLRGLTFKPANPDNYMEFMGDVPSFDVFREKGPAAKELEFCSQHFYSHLLHALEVIAYRYPDEEVNYLARCLFGALCNLMHLPVEDRDEFEDRLKYREWPSGDQPNNYVEAVTLMREYEQ